MLQSCTNAALFFDVPGTCFDAIAATFGKGIVRCPIQCNRTFCFVRFEIQYYKILGNFILYLSSSFGCGFGGNTLESYVVLCLLLPSLFLPAYAMFR